MDLRDGWRYSGVRGELEFLVRQHFTGEVKYWREGPEVRRQLMEIDTGEEVSPESDPVSRLEKFKRRIESWCQRGEVPLIGHFRAGYLKKMGE